MTIVFQKVDVFGYGGPVGLVDSENPDHVGSILRGTVGVVHRGLNEGVNGVVLVVGDGLETAIRSPLAVNSRQGLRAVETGRGGGVPVGCGRPRGDIASSQVSIHGEFVYCGTVLVAHPETSVRNQNSL